MLCPSLATWHRARMREIHAGKVLEEESGRLSWNILRGFQRPEDSWEPSTGGRRVSAAVREQVNKPAGPHPHLPFLKTLSHPLCSAPS